MSKARRAFGITAAVILSILSVIGILAVIGAGFVYPGTSSVPASPVAGDPGTYEWSESDAFDIESYPSITTEDGSIKILQLTDLHFMNQGTFGAGIGFNFILDGFMQAQVRKMVIDNDPDLVVVTGDLITVDYAQYAYGKLGEFFEELGVPWTVVMGNHDAGYTADKAALFNVLQQYDRFVFQFGPTNFTHVVTADDVRGGAEGDNKDLIGQTIYTGLGNFVINVKDDSGQIKQSLILMDSNDWNLEEAAQFKYSTPSADFYPMQVAWYRWVCAGLTAYNGGTPLPTSLYTHIGVGVDGTGHYGMLDAIAQARSTGIAFYGHTHAEGSYATDELANGFSFTNVNGVKAGINYMENSNTGGTLIAFDPSGNADVSFINETLVSTKTVDFRYNR